MGSREGENVSCHSFVILKLLLIFIEEVFTGDELFLRIIGGILKLLNIERHLLLREGGGLLEVLHWGQKTELKTLTILLFYLSGFRWGHFYLN